MFNRARVEKNWQNTECQDQLRPTDSYKVTIQAFLLQRDYVGWSMQFSWLWTFDEHNNKKNPGSTPQSKDNHMLWELGATIVIYYYSFEDKMMLYEDILDELIAASDPRIVRPPLCGKICKLCKTRCTRGKPKPPKVIAMCQKKCENPRNWLSITCTIMHLGV